MSFDGDDDTELRELVSATLQSSGVLGKIKAQLRSNVYLAIEGDEELKKKSKHVNVKLDKFAATTDGRLALQLIREFLAFFGLDYSLLVFEPEALEGRNVTIRDRDSLIEHLGFAETLSEDLPLLSEIIKLSKVSVLKSETPTPTSDSKQFSFKQSEDELSIQSDKSLAAGMKSPEVIPMPSANKSLQEMNKTYTMNESPAKSFLSDLPPLSGTPNASTGKKGLAPLKKVPPVAKVEATKKEEPKITRQTVEVKPMTKVEKDQPRSLSLDDDIDEEIDEFLNSSISASEDFTKEETVAEDASIKADYQEKLS